MQTRASLLYRIRDPKDDSAWAEFVRLYAPLLHSYSLRNGLQDSDAADLAQNTLLLVLRSAPNFVYDPGKGSFRGWLFTVARNEIRKFTTRQSKRDRGSGDSDIRRLLDEQPIRETDDDWEREYRIHLFHFAAEKVRPDFREQTWQAFWRTVVLTQPIEAVAADLNISTGAVYIARSRVVSKIRDVIAGMQENEE